MNKVELDLYDFDKLREDRKRLNRIQELMKKLPVEFTGLYRNETSAGYGGGQPFVNLEVKEMDNLLLSIRRELGRVYD